jgi:aspartate kinase
VPGFLATRRQQIVTLGRGGSDLSAVLLAAALDGDCVLVKDVDGYHTADPATDREARPITDLSHGEAIAMADAGCPLVQRQALVAARGEDVTLVVRSVRGRGTTVRTGVNRHSLQSTSSIDVLADRRLAAATA